MLILVRVVKLLGFKVRQKKLIQYSSVSLKHRRTLIVAFPAIICHCRWEEINRLRVGSDLSYPGGVRYGQRAIFQKVGSRYGGPKRVVHRLFLYITKGSSYFSAEISISSWFCREITERKKGSWVFYYTGAI